jgi:hypothetical protein
MISITGIIFARLLERWLALTPAQREEQYSRFIPLLRECEAMPHDTLDQRIARALHCMRSMERINEDLAREDDKDGR